MSTDDTSAHLQVEWVLYVDDILPLERLIRQQIPHAFRLEIELFNSLPSIDIARCLDGHNVRAVREHL